MVKLYDEKTITTFVWPDSETARLAKGYWLPMMRSGSSSAFINNVETQMLLLSVDDVVLPVTVNSQAYENSYVCSFYSHYITYAKDELTTLQFPLLEKLLALLITGAGCVLKGTKINRAVIVNNWMLSTNLYPALLTPQLAAITEHLQAVFPSHAIAFRSINTVTEAAISQSLQTLGYQMVGSRQVYLFDPQKPGLDEMRSRRKKRYLHQDHRLFATEDYEVIDARELQPHDLPRLVELYNALYLHKYSFNNPQFNQNCLSLMIRHGSLHPPFLTLKALRKAGKIDAVVGFYTLNGVMTTPLLGYDTRLPKNTGLYRMLTTYLIEAGEQQNLLINQSSGAASFKWRRGFTGHIEYTAVFHRHLSFYRRLGWWLLAGLVDWVAIPLIKKYNL
ncbi:MAG: hypothetical protein WA783_16850 [Phormidesmis sp.]